MGNDDLFGKRLISKARGKCSCTSVQGVVLYFILIDILKYLLLYQNPGDSLQGAKRVTRGAIQPTPVSLPKPEGDGTSTTVPHGYNLRNRVLA